MQRGAAVYARLHQDMRFSELASARPKHRSSGPNVPDERKDRV